MGDKSTVRVTYLGDATALARASKKAQASLDGVSQQADRSNKSSSKSFLSMGKAAKAGIAGLVGGSLVAGAKAVFDMSANMQLMDAKAKTVFGNQIGVVQKWAKANAAAMGLTSREATTLSANFADLLIPMGFTREHAAKMSTEVVGLSGALSQWSGGTRSAAEVSAILAKAMLGERDGLKDLGISISDADVKARLLKNGWSKLTGEALQQATAVATQQLIMEKSSDAQAAYAKNTDSLAARKAKLTAKIKELRDGAIAALIPKLVQLGNWINTNVVPAVQRLVDGFKNGTGAGGKIRETFEKYTKVLRDNRPAIENVISTLRAVAEIIVTKVMPVMATLATHHLAAMIKAAGSIVTAFRVMVKVVLAVLGAIVNGAAKAFGWVPGLGPKLRAAAREFEQFSDSVTASLDGIPKTVNITVIGQVKGAAFSGKTMIDPVNGGSAPKSGSNRLAPAAPVPSRSASTRSTWTVPTDATYQAEKTKKPKKATAAQKMVKAYAASIDGVRVYLRSASKVTVDAAKAMAARVAGVAAQALAPLDRAIEASKQRLAALRQQSAQLRELARSNAASFASVLGFQAEEGKKTTAGDVLVSMRERLAKVREFAANMRKLAKAGLNKQTFAEILSAGVEGGGAVAAALAADPSSVGSLNGLQGQVNKESSALGGMGSSYVYGDRIKAEAANLAKMQNRRKELGTIRMEISMDGKVMQTKLLKLKRELGGNLGLA